MIPKKALPEYGPLLLSSAAAPVLGWFLLAAPAVGGVEGDAAGMLWGLAGAILFSPAAVFMGFLPALVISAPLLGLSGWLAPPRRAAFGYAAAGAVAGGLYSLLAWLMSKQYPLGDTEGPPDLWLGTFLISSGLYVARSSGGGTPGWYLLSVAPMAGVLAGLLYWSRLRR